MADPPVSYDTPPSRDKRFALRTSQQSISQLLKTPAEVRMKILRNLLKTSYRIKPLGESSHEWAMEREPISPENYRKVNARSSQLLRCCQQLYWEGVPILYEENVLEIEAYTADDNFNMMPSTFFVKMLDTIFELPSRVFTLQKQEYNTLPITCVRSKRIYPSEEAKYGGIIVGTREFYAILDRFSNLRLRIRSTNQKQIYIVCFSLRKFVYGKGLTIFDESGFSFLKSRSFLCIRTKTVHFKKPNPEEASKVAQVASVIVSQQYNNSDDLVTIYSNFIIDFLQKIPERYIRHRLVEGLEQALFDCDETKFQRCRRVILDHIRTESEAWVPLEIARIIAEQKTLEEAALAQYDNVFDLEDAEQE